MNKLIAIAFSAAMMGLTSCKKEDVEKNAEAFDSYLKIGETIYDLNGDNLYYTLTDYYDARYEISLGISDGILNNQYGGNNLSEYEGGSYFGRIYLYSAIGEQVILPGDFLMNYDNAQEGIENQQLADIYLKMQNVIWEHYSLSSQLQQGVLSVSGGTEIGDQITIDFSGQIAFYYDVENHGNYVTKSIELHIQAEVQDGVEY